MSWKGRVETIIVGERVAAPLGRVPTVEAVPGRGLKGDRKFKEGNEPGRQITLIEREALEGIEREYGIPLTPEEARRNVVTEGVPLNHLVGREFRVGSVRLRGVKLCEPCGHLEKLTGKAVLKGLAHRGGLRAEILSGGVIREGDSVEEA
jgi:MOSC domain-containing protein YiiM